MKMSKVSSAKYYQNNKESLQKTSREKVFPKKKKEKATKWAWKIEKSIWRWKTNRLIIEKILIMERWKCFTSKDWLIFSNVQDISKISFNFFLQVLYTEMLFFRGSAHFRRLYGFNFLKKVSVIKSKLFHRFYKFDHLIATDGTLDNILSYVFDLITPIVSNSNCFNRFILFL